MLMKVVAIRILNTQCGKGKFRKFLYPTQIQYVLQSLPCTRQNQIRFCAKHFAIKTVLLFFSRCFLLDVSCYRHWLNVNQNFLTKLHSKSWGRGGRCAGSGLEIGEAATCTPLLQAIAQATVYSTVFSPHCSLVIALRRVH
jgi:hypothetical protein